MLGCHSEPLADMRTLGSRLEIYHASSSDGTAFVHLRDGVHFALPHLDRRAATRIAITKPQIETASAPTAYYDAHCSGKSWLWGSCSWRPRSQRTYGMRASPNRPKEAIPGSEAKSKQLVSQIRPRMRDNFASPESRFICFHASNEPGTYIWRSVPRGRCQARK